MPPSLQGQDVLANATFQELALYAREDNAAALRERAHVLGAMDIMHVQWLALPAIKSGGTCALYALGNSIWHDEAFCNDMRKYAAVVGNRAAEAFLAMLVDKTITLE